MLNQQKPLIFTIHKIKKYGNHLTYLNQKGNPNGNFKRRLPWIKEEDDAIITLVKKYGTKNWAIVASKLGELFSNKIRTGKKCRERWHNHLDSNIKKEYWTEREEAILFLKHMEYGNKWSDIAKFLPGRTDNSIKNHFYSKLRKFIRKILKVLHKDNVFEEYGLDTNYYTSDNIYKIIKKNNVPYDKLSKDVITDMILNHDKTYTKVPNNEEKIDVNMERKFRKIRFISLSKKKVEIKKLRLKSKNNLKFRKINGSKTSSKNPENKENVNNLVTNMNMNDPENTKENLNKQYIHDMFLNPSNVASFLGKFEINNNKNLLSNNNNNTSSNDYLLPNMVNSVPILCYNPAINNIQLTNRFNKMNEVNRSENIFQSINKNLIQNDDGFNQQISQSQPEFTVKLLQTLSKISNDSKSSNNKDSIDQNCVNYFNFSDAHTSQAFNEMYTFNNRFLPQVNLNHNMSSFTLANNNTINNSIHENVIQATNINEIDNPPFANNLNSQNAQQGDININNLMIGPSCIKNNYNSLNLNYPVNANVNFIKTSSHDFNDNLKNSFDSDCFFHDKNPFNLNTLSQNMSRSFYQFKSFNCLDADLLNDDCNISSIFHNKKSFGINTNSTPNLNINNSLPSDGNPLDNFKNSLDINSYINLKNNNSSFNYTLSNMSGNFNNNNSSTFNQLNTNLNSKYHGNHSQVISPKKLNSNGLTISLKSAFVKNMKNPGGIKSNINSGGK